MDVERLREGWILIPEELVGISHSLSTKETEVTILYDGLLEDSMKDDTTYRFVAVPEGDLDHLACGTVTDEMVKRAIDAQRRVDDRIAAGESTEGEFEAMEQALLAAFRVETGEQE